MIRTLRKRAPILVFGILQIFFTAPGQTFLIALFVGPMFTDLGVSQSVFAGLYSAATLCAGLLLSPCGRLLDKYPVKPILLGMILLMATGCIAIATSKSIPSLFLGFFLIRFIGQGAFGLTASTIITKHFKKNRGKALGIITMGFPLSEIIFPGITIALLGLFGWRHTYIIFAAMLLIVMIPIQFYLLSRANVKQNTFYPEELLIQPQRLRGFEEDTSTETKPHYTLKKTLSDPIFYIILSASTIPPIVMTGLFFHQSTLFSTHNWPIILAASGLSIYAITKAVAALLIGPVIDRYGSGYPFAVVIAMIATGTYMAAIGGSTLTIYLYLGILGAALGMSAPVMNHLWASLYGSTHIGSIKGFVGTFRNGLTGFGPLPIAIALDNGISMPLVLLYTAMFIGCMSIIPVLVTLYDKRL